MIFIIFSYDYALKLFETYKIKSKQIFWRMTFHIKLHVYNWNIISMNCAKNVLGIKN